MSVSTSVLNLALLLAAPDPPDAWRAVEADPPVDRTAVDADRRLVARIQDGDADAFRTLMEREFPVAVRFGTSIVHDREAAADLAQDVFAKVWMHRAEWFPHTSPRAYLLGAVRHGAMNLVKHRAVRARYATSGMALFEEVTEPVSTEVLEQTAELLALRQAIARLPERRRMAIALRYEHGLSHAEVGVALEISPKAAKELLARTLSALYTELRSLR